MAYTLKNNVQSEVCENLYLNDELADVRFVFNVNDKVQKVPANKANLAALSPVFYSMFFGELKEKGDVNIVDADAEAFQEFLQLFYLSEVTLTMECIETVARLADKYDVVQYINVCANFLESQLTVENMCWGYQLALFLNNKTLIKFCENEIAISSEEILASDVFERCELNTLKRILQLDLACNEMEVFNACLKWAKHACRINDLNENQMVNLRLQLGDCLKLIRFGNMQFEEFGKLAAMHKGLFTPDEFEDIIFTLSINGYESKIFNRNPRGYLWDTSKVLTCQRVLRTEQREYHVRSSEIVRFMSNQMVLFGKMHSAITYNLLFDHGLCNDTVDIIISEVSNHAHSEKILYEGALSKPWSSDGKAIVVLTKPILIKPKIVYEIQLKLETNGISRYYSTWKPTVNLENGLKIDFLRSPSVNYDTSISGWISELVLNTI